MTINPTVVNIMEWLLCKSQGIIKQCQQTRSYGDLAAVGNVKYCHSRTLVDFVLVDNYIKSKKQHLKKNKNQKNSQSSNKW